MGHPGDVIEAGPLMRGEATHEWGTRVWGEEL